MRHDAHTTAPQPRHGLAARWLPPLIIALLVVAVYAPTLRHAFVYDDHSYIRTNPAVITPTPTNVFADTYPPGRPEHRLYRPLLTLSYAADAALARSPERHAAWTHAHNLLLHLAVSLLLWALLRHRAPPGSPSVSSSPRSATRELLCAPPLLIAALYALHPALTETVAWASGRSEGLLGLWAILGLHAATRPRLKPWLRSALLTLLTALAILTKESGVVLPFLWACAATLDRREPLSLDRAAGIFGAPMALVLLLLSIRFCTGGGLTPEIHVYAGLSPGHRWTVTGMALARYLRLAIAPQGLTVHWPPLPLALHRGAALTGGVGFVAMALAGLYGLRRQRPWALGPIWFAGTLFIYSNILIRIGSIFGERFLYLPLLGAALLAADGLYGLLATRSPVRRRVAVGACVLLIGLTGLAALATARRVYVWATDLTLWRATHHTAPDNAIAAIAYPFYLLKEGSPESLADARAAWPAIRTALPPSLTPAMRERAQWVEQQLRAHP